MQRGTRLNPRLRTRLRVSLVSKYGEDRAVLVNLSCSGACIEWSDPPAKLGDLVLRWGEFEAYGEMAWLRGHRVGIHFENAIPYEWVLRTRELTDDTGPSIQEIREAARIWVQGERAI